MFKLKQNYNPYENDPVATPIVSIKYVMQDIHALLCNVAAGSA